MSTLTFKKLLALTGTAALILAGCAGSNDQEAVNDDPQAALEQALENLANYDGTTFELSLESTPESLTALAEGDLTEDQAEQILDSSLEITTKESEDIRDQQFELIGNIAGQNNAFEMKVLGITLFVRADVDGLVETFGADPSEVDALRQQYGSQPGFEFIGTLLDGDWVSLTGIEEFAEQMTGQSPFDEQNSEEARDLSRNLAQALEENSSVEAGDKEGPGGHLIVSVNVKSLYEDYKSRVESAGGFPAGSGTLPDGSEVPDRDLLLDTWVDDEQVTQFELDITQFADWEGSEFPEGVDDFRLRVTVAEFTGDVEEPDAAAEVDFAELMQLFMGGVPGSGSGQGGPGSPSNDQLCNEIEASLEGQPDEVIDQAKELYGSMCPNL